MSSIRAHLFIPCQSKSPDTRLLHSPRESHRNGQLLHKDLDPKFDTFLTFVLYPDQSC